MSAVDSAAVLAQQAAIRQLIAQNLYDTKIVAQLEENVKFQVRLTDAGDRAAAAERRRRPAQRADHWARRAVRPARQQGIGGSCELASWRTRLTTALLLAFPSLSAQIKSGSYDGESNRELLKLYAVAPDMIRLVSGGGRQRSCGAADGCDSQPRS